MPLKKINWSLPSLFILNQLLSSEMKVQHNCILQFGFSTENFPSNIIFIVKLLRPSLLRTFKFPCCSFEFGICLNASSGSLGKKLYKIQSSNIHSWCSRATVLHVLEVPLLFSRSSSCVEIR